MLLGLLLVSTGAAAMVAAGAAAAPITLAFDAVTPLHTVADKYVSFNIDTGSLYNGMDFSDVRLRYAGPVGPPTACSCYRAPGPSACRSRLRKCV
jgi:hypothetical protein